MQHILIFLTVVILSLITGAGIGIWHSESKQPTIQVQKYSFSEQCQDGLRVDYESTIRKPKSVVCAPAVGE